MKIYIDITNMLLQEFVSGIQRVVREITVRMVQKEETRNHEIILLFYNDYANKFVVIDNEKYLMFIDGRIKNNNKCFTLNSLSIFDFESGSIFFDIDAVWMNKVKRSFLLPLLKNHNVRVIAFFHDLIPITHSQFFDPSAILKFSNFIAAHLKHSDQIVVSTKSTLIELEAIQKRIGMKHKESIILPFGFDFNYKARYLETNIADIVKKIKENGPYVLCVGTIEIRKNHKIILDAFETKLYKYGIQLIFAGRIGWMVDNLLARIANQAQKNKQFYFLENLNDASIDYLYENAFLTVSASFVEGFGLPLIESIMRGTPVIASDIPVFREVGGEYCDYFNPEDVNDLIQKVEYLLNNPEIYAEKKKSLSSYKPMTWDESEELFSQQLFIEQKTEITHQHLKQIVIRSERIEILIETISFIEHFLPFISEIVIYSSKENGKKIMQQYLGKLKIILLTGEENIFSKNISGDYYENFSFLSDDRIDNEFILSEEVYRPLIPLVEEYYIQNGKYRAYYCGDFFAGELLSNNSFLNDRQTKTTLFLKKNNYPSLNYDSHMPQVINKSWFLDMIRENQEIMEDGLCEWSTYFNYSVHNHPNAFSVLTYQTLNWEFGPNDIESFVRPQKYYFENFCEELYVRDQEFCNFSQNWYEGSITENFEKIQVFEHNRQQTEFARISGKVFSQIYRRRYLEMPSFVMEYYRDKLRFYVPEVYVIVNESCAKIELSIIWRDIPDHNGPVFTIEWNLYSLENVQITDSSHIDVLAGQRSVKIQLSTQILNRDVLLKLTGKMTLSGKVFSKNIRVQAIYL